MVGDKIGKWEKNLILGDEKPSGVPDVPTLMLLSRRLDRCSAKAARGSRGSGRRPREAGREARARGGLSSH